MNQSQTKSEQTVYAVAVKRTERTEQGERERENQAATEQGQAYG